MNLGGERFTIVQAIGSGGMGVVYRARDGLLELDVALKTLRGGSGRDLYRFKREFRTLADLNHPNLCQLHELHTADDQWFFTMELIDGVTFLDWVRPLATALDDTDPTGPSTGPASSRPARGPLRLDRLAAALPQLVDGVLALHHADKLHRDLKPSNVMVTPSGRLVLLDFGLVATVASDDRTHEAAAVGTPTYMSPEQAADRPLTAASDWYAVGVMLYEALTDRRPFDGTIQQVLHKKQSDRPLPPGAIDPSIPPALEQLCLDLLEREPTARPDAAAILRVLGGGPSATTAGIARDARRAPFVGRTAELATLAQAWRDARAGAVAVVVVRGESGIGKSALLREFRRRVEGEALILSGRCYDRESMPFKALDPIVDALTSALLALPIGTIMAALPAEIAPLARLFPVLRRVPAVADRVVLAPLPADPLALRARAFAGLRALLRALAKLRPIVITIDDLQWGDEDSAAVLVELIHNPEPLPLLLVLVHRNDDDGGVVAKIITPRAAFASGIARLIALGPLGDADARELVVNLGAGDATTEIAIRDAHGHPMFLTELVRSPRVHATASTVEDVIRGRLAALPTASAEILRVVAIANYPVPLGLAIRAAGGVAGSGDLPRLRTERLVRVHHRAALAEASLEPYHDRIRRAVLAELGADQQRALHAALARALERDGAADRDALIAHWLGAGEPARAALYAATAAADAAEQLAFHRAARLFQLAIDHGGAVDADRRALHRQLAGVLVNAGQLLGAAAAYEAAAEGASAVERLDLDLRRLEQVLRGGAAREGFELARELLARVGHTLPQGDRHALRAIVLERARLALRGLRFRPREERDLAPDVIQHLDTLRSVATSVTLGNPMHGRLIQFQFLRAALAAGEPRRVCIALTYELGYSAQRGARSLARQDEVMTLLRTWVDRIGDPQLVAIADGIAGIARYLSGRFREARDLMERGMTGLRDQGGGARWELDVTISFWLGVLFYLGDTRPLARQVPGFLRDASERGDVFALRALRGWRGNMAWLIVGRPTAARSHLAAAIAASAETNLTIQRYYELVSQVQIELYEGEGATAARLLAEVAPRLPASQLLRIQAIRIELAFLRGRAAVAATTDRAATITAVRLEVRALRGERVAWADAHALQLDATLHHLGGDRTATLAALSACAAAYAACDLGLLATIARWRHGALLGGAAGAAQVEAAVEALRAGAIADPPAIARMMWPWPDDDSAPSA
jgi:tRNA A-37 threonylcarbamoyl transferase component Bud32